MKIIGVDRFIIILLFFSSVVIILGLVPGLGNRCAAVNLKMGPYLNQFYKKKMTHL